MYQNDDGDEFDDNNDNVCDDDDDLQGPSQCVQSTVAPGGKPAPQLFGKPANILN